MSRGTPSAGNLYTKMNINDSSRIACDPASPQARSQRRAALIAQRQARSASRSDTQISALFNHLRDAVGEVRGKTLGLYWPVRGEPPLGALPSQWQAQGAQLALPVVDGPGQALRFVQWRVDAPTVPGAYGILRPACDLAARPDLLLVPCLGFDVRGYRLGYGGGFYDRTLAALAAQAGGKPIALGVAWDEGLLDDFEPLPTDIALDAVVTPSGLTVPGQAGQSLQARPGSVA